MEKDWREPILNIVGMHLIVLYLAAVALISRYWIMPFLP